MGGIGFNPYPIIRAEEGNVLQAHRGDPIMGRLHRAIVLAGLCLPAAALGGVVTADAADAGPRHRLVVMTDIGGDPDDEQSIVRFLLYACDFDVEGLCTGLGWGHDKKTRPDLIEKAVRAYGRVLPRLREHRSDYPSMETLLGLIKRGHDTAKHDVGKGLDAEASDWIFRVLDRPDPRPVWFTVWGGPRELAQAVWKASTTRSAEEFAALKRKIRVYSVADQDKTAAWVKANHPDVVWLYARRLYRGIWHGEPAPPCSPVWLKRNVLEGHGPLGGIYPPKAAGKVGVKEGDTPSFFYLLPDGLGVPEHPEWGGWGGRFMPVGGGREYQDAADDRAGKSDALWTVARWRHAYQNAFAARMDWCVKPRAGANHGPVAVCNGDAGRGILTKDVKPGEKVTLSAAGSRDPDGNRLVYRWWIYREAGTCVADVSLDGAETAEASLVVPPDASGTIHVILEVTDDGDPPLTAYRRVVLKAPTVEVRIADGSLVFYRAVNLNGKSVEIDGNRWEGDGAPDFACGDKALATPGVKPQPPADPARTAMLTTFRWSRDVRAVFRKVPAGTYAVFATVFEDNNPETLTFSVEGCPVLRGYRSGTAGTWRRLGPWIARVGDGTLELAVDGGAANLSGVEVWRCGAAPAEKPAAAPTQRTAKSGGPIALHPDNGHYFLWRGKPTVLVTSGEHYGALLNLDFDYVRYFDALRADGLNHTRIFAGTYREIPGSFKITDNTLAPKPRRYAAPWARTKTKGYFDGGGKFNLERWDASYFERLRALLAAARERGVVVELCLFCPLYNEALWKASPMHASNNVNGVGTCKRTEVLTLKHEKLLAVQLAFARKVVREVSAFDNLYFEICNEPYFGGVTMDWQRRIADVIVETGKDLPRRHLISMNVANGCKKVVDPHPAVSIFNFHYCVPPDAVAVNFGLGKVVGENETGFRGRQDVLYRTEGWAFLLAGGGLYNNLDYSFTPKHPDGTFAGYTSPGGGSPALRKQLGLLKRFIEGFDFVRMRPAAKVVRKVTPALSVQALAERARAYAIYLHVPLPKKPKRLEEHLKKGVRARVELDLPPGRYRAEWIDTKTGGSTRQGPFDAGAPLQSPPFDNDIALKVVAADSK
jgi:hypothetical protein